MKRRLMCLEVGIYVEETLKNIADKH